MKTGGEVRFRRFSLITLFTVYSLILAGGIVRSTGSGMGCPDWPRCFGRLIPPVNESQLPPDYKTKYKVHGYEAVFNVTKTWIEYLNRLLGAVTGILVIILLVYSLPFLKTDKIVFICSLLLVCLTGFEAWLGKLVVSSNLSPWMVTVHMSGSLIILAILIFLISYTRKRDFRKEVYNLNRPIVMLIVLLLAIFLQIAIGTQIREQIDEISASLNYAYREVWIGKLDFYFDIHKTISIILLVVSVYFAFKLKTVVKENPLILKITSLLLSFLSLEILLGVFMSYFSIPAFMQPLHLLLASVIFGIEFFILISLYSIKNMSLKTAIAK